MDRLPRERFGLALTGEVLEIGPGTTPFPTAPEAVVRFVDRPMPGGRDANFPELVGEPHGPDAHYDRDLDRDGLGGIADSSYDAVVLSHVIEHLADPIKALQECRRVLGRTGKLALIVPLRHATFDSLRPGTTLAHLLDEHRAGVTEVDEEHIREFCHSVYNQTPVYPSDARERHNPDRLDDDLIALHQRRSIHAHCWDAEEMAAALVGLIAVGELGFALVDVFFDDDPGAADIEFGLLLQPGPTGPAAAATLVDAWTDAVLGDADRDPARVTRFTEVLARDLSEVGLPADQTRALVARPATVAASRLRQSQQERQELASTLEATAGREGDLAVHLAARDAELVEVRASRTYRAGRVVTAPLRLVRRLRRSPPPPATP